MSEAWPRVLVVDDDPGTRALCSMNLELAGVEVVEAEDGQAGLERALADPPNLLVLDVRMPGLDGAGCCSEAHSAPGSAPYSSPRSAFSPAPVARRLLAPRRTATRRQSPARRRRTTRSRAIRGRGRAPRATTTTPGLAAARPAAAAGTSAVRTPRLTCSARPTSVRPFDSRSRRRTAPVARSPLLFRPRSSPARANPRRHLRHRLLAARAAQAPRPSVRSRCRHA
jgi:CheY-like chemotaxis protein